MKNGESNSNSRSDYYEDSDEKVHRRGGQPGISHVGQGQQVIRNRDWPDGVAHNVSIAGPGGAVITD